MQKQKKDIFVALPYPLHPTHSTPTLLALPHLKILATLPRGKYGAGMGNAYPNHCHP